MNERTYRWSGKGPVLGLAVVVLGTSGSVVEHLVQVVLRLLVREIQVDFRERGLVTRHCLIQLRQSPLLPIQCNIQLTLHRFQMLNAYVLLQIFQCFLHFLSRFLQDLRGIPLPLRNREWEWNPLTRGDLLLQV